jgi:diguanylate cyclase (GGDEF)-like protein
MAVMEHGNVPMGRILVVDDMPANLRLMLKMLSEHGYVVLPAIGSEVALRLLQHTLPDLILLDIIMPGMNGYEVCERLKADEHTRDIPVIFISAVDEAMDKVRAFACGGVDYIVKPFQEEEVLARVRTHLSLRNLQRHLEDRVRERTAELMESNVRLRQEIAERKQAEEQVRYMSHYDTLTGLPNRVLLEDRIKQAIARSAREATRTAVLFLDLDDFKNINDSLGHQIGDTLLQMAAMRLQLCVRKDDSVGRLGGDEFVLCLPSLSDSTDAVLVAQKALETLGQAFFHSGHELHISASIGISIYPDDGDDSESLMRAADTAMYYAKEKGRNNYQFFTPQLNDAIQQRLALANRLRQALSSSEFEVYYQPQVNMENGAVFSAEALLRWHQPGEAPASCAAFISVAEETGLIVPIGEWVMRQACLQLKQWHDAGYPHLRIAVNLSPRQFHQPNIADVIAQIVRESGVPADALNLEITENILLQRNEDNMAVLRYLSELGIQFSIDDFGTGYSNLAYLQRFPVHSLKIDRSFVSGIDQDSNNTALVAAIIAMAQSLHLKVLAEGVETREQINFLLSHGCLAAQGFYYGKALSSLEFTDLLHKSDVRAGPENLD